MYTILYTILTPSNGIVWYCKTPMEKAKSLVFCKMAFRGIVLYQGFDFLSLRKTKGDELKFNELPFNFAKAWTKYGQ